MAEQWIEFRPGYEISDNGNVRSLNRVVRNRRYKGKILTPNKNNWGYMFLGYPRFYIHRMVAKCFITNPENKKYVNHKDGNKINNHVSNLEWATKSEDLQHAYDTGLRNNKI